MCKMLIVAKRHYAIYTNRCAQLEESDGCWVVALRWMALSYPLRPLVDWRIKIDRPTRSVSGELNTSDLKESWTLENKVNTSRVNETDSQ